MDGVDYYDYAPTVVMTRSVVLGGMPGTPYREVGYELAALTGVSLMDLDRWVEHRIGRTIWDYKRSISAPMIGKLEDQALLKALSSLPNGLIIAGEMTLANEINLRAIRNSAGLAFLKLSPEVAYWRVRDKIAERGPRQYHSIEHPLTTFEQFYPLAQLMANAETEAELLYDVEQLSSNDILRRLREMLPKLSEGRS